MTNFILDSVAATLIPGARVALDNNSPRVYVVIDFDGTTLRITSPEGREIAVDGLRLGRVAVYTESAA